MAGYSTLRILKIGRWLDEVGEDRFDVRHTKYPVRMHLRYDL